VSGLAGVAGAAVVGAAGVWWMIPLAAWDAAALVFVGWMWRTVWPLDAAATASHASREDPGRASTDVGLLVASVASLAAVGVILVQAGQRSGLEKGLLVGMAIASIVLSWSVVHTVYGLRYAKLYYDGEPGGINFHDDDAPCYRDFAYLAATIGMTFQVSDTDLGSKELRHTALRHALLSYAFGTLIIAATINLVAGLSS
jgi:uncharacterized membrane protein